MLLYTLTWKNNLQAMYKAQVVNVKGGDYRIDFGWNWLRMKLTSRCNRDSSFDNIKRQSNYMLYVDWGKRRSFFCYGFLLGWAIAHPRKI